MTDQAEIEVGSALTLPEASQLPSLYNSGQIDQIIGRIEKEALAIAPDLSTAKGRKEVASLAHKVARSKTALDNAGRELTEEARRKVEAVNAERKKVRDRLDELKAKVRKPLDEWEEAEAARKAAHRERLGLFALDRTDWQKPSDEIARIIAEVEAIDVETGWDEFADMAADAKKEALAKYRSDHTAAKGREDQEAEIARLRAEQEERERAEAERKAKERREREEAEAKQRAEQEERERIEAERKAKEREIAAQKERADAMIDYINECREGSIGGAPQPFGILLYELEEKIVIDDRFGDHRRAVEAIRDAAIEHLKSEMARQAEERAARAPEQEEAPKQTDARDLVVKDISAAIAKLKKAEIAEAIVVGKIPHVAVMWGGE